MFDPADLKDFLSLVQYHPSQRLIFCLTQFKPFKQASATRQEIMEGIPKYTNSEPLIQIGEVKL